MNSSYATVWPNFKDTNRITRAVKAMSSPQPNWKICKVDIVYQTRSYLKAEKKLNVYKTTSDVGEISTDADVSVAEDDVQEVSRYQPQPSSSEKTDDNLNGCTTCRENSVTLKKLLVSFNQLKQMCEYHFDTLQKVIPEKSTLQLCNFKPAVDFLELQQLNDELGADEHFSSMVSSLSLLGGKDPADAIRRILSKLITTGLAMQMNWVGGDKKRSIQEFSLVIQLIVASLRKNRLYEGTTQSAAEDTIKKWLRTASDRDGGRSRRMRLQMNT